ncbi:MAG TPA: hypothetical protein VMX14_00945 [Anaerolineae bacterium]|nr:hypothetical protein [Anaerolineae bacterium]
MPRNPQKRRCKVEGCRAWAMRGKSLCSSHTRSRAVRERSGQIMPLLLALESTPDGPPTDIKLINEELEKLREGRRYFMHWVKEFRAQDPADRRGLSPWAFLRAWNDSTARIMQLLRERRALTGQKEGELGEIMESVYDLLETSPGVEALETKQAAAGEDASEPGGLGMTER